MISNNLSVDFFSFLFEGVVNNLILFLQAKTVKLKKKKKRNKNNIDRNDGRSRVLLLLCLTVVGKEVVYELRNISNNRQDSLKEAIANRNEMALNIKEIVNNDKRTRW